MTDVAIREALSAHTVEIIWKPSEELPLHSNGMRLEALDESDASLAPRRSTVLACALLSDELLPDIYPAKTLSEILAGCERSGQSFWEYVIHFEALLFGTSSTRSDGHVRDH